jgi:hypothetical protein
MFDDIIFKVFLSRKGWGMIGAKPESREAIKKSVSISQ